MIHGESVRGGWRRFNRKTMNYPEIEEFLYTDIEVQQQIEDNRRLPMRVQRRSTSTFVEPEQAWIARIDKRCDREEFRCPKFESSIPWPVLARESSGDGRGAALESMETGPLGKAG